jgi:hypothetical protein
MPVPDLPPLGELPGLFFVSRPEGARVAVACIHGLGGHPYESWGRKREPGTFLRRLARDRPEMAVATYGYSSGARDLFDPKRLKVRSLVKLWGGTVRDSLLGRYRSVAIVCHSLGGVITQAALRDLIVLQPEWERRMWADETRLGVFFMGVPQHGTDTKLMSWLADELRVLKYNGEMVEANSKFWKNRVKPPDRALEKKRDLPIATFAVVSETDDWVPQISAEGSVEEGDLKTVELSHGAMVKPPLDGGFAPYDFVLERLVAWQRERIPPRRVRPPAEPAVPYVDRPAIVAAHKRAGDRIDEALDALDGGDPVRASRSFLKAVLVAVGALKSEYEGILYQAAGCSVDQPEEVQALLERIDEYRKVSHLKQHLDDAEEGLTQCREALRDLEPARIQALADGLESVSKLIRSLLDDAGTGVGIEWLRRIHEYIRRGDATDEGLQTIVRAAEADAAENRLARYVDRIRKAGYGLIETFA